MSSEEEQTPTLAEGNKNILHCPFCGVNFSGAFACNRKARCPEEGGCGKSFVIYEK